jgi:putative membrane protein
MKPLKLVVLFITGFCLLQACQSSENKGTENNENTTTLASDSTLDTIGTNNKNELKDDETGFIQQAGVGGMMELEAANLVLQKSKNSKVRAFAQMMIKDHTKANAALQKLATNKGLQLPATFPREQQKHLDVLNEFSDKGLDRQYMEMMVSDHIKTLELFRKAATFNDPDIKAFAANTIPVLEGHYKAANSLNDSIQKQKMNNGDDNSNVERDAKKPN